MPGLSALLSYTNWLVRRGSYPHLIVRAFLTIPTNFSVITAKLLEPLQRLTTLIFNYYDNLAIITPVME